MVSSRLLPCRGDFHSAENTVVAEHKGTARDFLEVG